MIEENFCCAIVPTYDNVNTLEKVLADLAQYIPHIIVVNDGSSDNSDLLLSDLQQKFHSSSVTLEVIHCSTNKGKGAALRKGFERAVAAGFRYAITIDSDGQHFADDIPAFVEMIREYPDSLIVGARNMQQEGVPGKAVSVTVFPISGTESKPVSNYPIRSRGFAYIRLNASVTHVFLHASTSLKLKFWYALHGGDVTFAGRRFRSAMRRKKVVYRISALSSILHGLACSILCWFLLRFFGLSRVT